MRLRCLGRFRPHAFDAFSGDPVRRLVRASPASRPALALAAALGACGGGSDGASASCPLPEQKSWLAGYMDDWYFWYALKPSPDPNDAAFDSIDKFFAAELYQGTSATFPKDRWSFLQTSSSFDQFFGEGKTLGYGVSVAGLEVAGQPEQPLRVRYVEPASPRGGPGRSAARASSRSTARRRPS